MSDFKRAIRENRRGKISVALAPTAEELDALKTRVELFQMCAPNDPIAPYIWLIGYSMDFDPVPLGAEPLVYNAIMHTDYAEGTRIVTLIELVKRGAE